MCSSAASSAWSFQQTARFYSIASMSAVIWSHSLEFWWLGFRSFFRWLVFIQSSFAMCCNSAVRLCCFCIWMKRLLVTSSEPQFEWHARWMQLLCVSSWSFYVQLLRHVFLVPHSDFHLQNYEEKRLMLNSFPSQTVVYSWKEIRY